MTFQEEQLLKELTRLLTPVVEELRGQIQQIRQEVESLNLDIGRLGGAIATAKAETVDHSCEALVEAAENYGNLPDLTLVPPSIKRGRFGIMIRGIPEDAAFPERNPNAERYIPFGTHCPYCGEEVR